MIPEPLLNRFDERFERVEAGGMRVARLRRGGVDLFASVMHREKEEESGLELRGESG
jgi:hypothetical protein